MIIKTKNTSYACFRAEQHKDNIYLYDAEDKLDIILQDPTIVEIQDGSIVIIEEKDPTQLDVIEAQLAYNSMMLGTLMEV